MNSLVQSLTSYLTSGTVIARIAAAAGTIIAAVVIVKILNRLIIGWLKRYIASHRAEAPQLIAPVETKVRILRQIITAGIYFFGLVIFLLQFEAVRSIGAGLLASAGIAGLVIGMAAQNTLSNIIGGISVSFTQPVRLNDAVIFDNEFGWIEEISLMHTIIKTWDNRRIMVPNNVLVNKVIQNWTIKDASLLGVVMLYTDYTCDVEKIKQWVKEIVDTSPNATSDRLAGVQVVDFTEKTMVIRILSKGPDAPRTWDLRCEIREQLVKKFTQEGLALPRFRIEGTPPLPTA